MMAKKHNNVYLFFLWLSAVLYVAAGINHFLATKVYLSIVPPWMPVGTFLIYLSGVAEIILGILLLFKRTRKWAGIFIALMLVVYLPLHIYMLQLAPFMLGKLMVTKLIAWIRLPIQAVLIFWAAVYIKNP
ncbi:putative membrane protein [Pedobacter sp. UYP30]|uniref:DoxX family protein n=1 Tax=Pedobacter sp. UYP30 TaxID=1756400 RepID=UPI003393CFDF